MDKSFEGVNPDAAFLQSHVAAAGELQAQLDHPKAEDVHLAPDLMERTLSYLHEIMYQAHVEFLQVIKDKPQQKKNLGKHPRTSDDAERAKGQRNDAASTTKDTKDRQRVEPEHRSR